jgi:hypothetical protein
MKDWIFALIIGFCMIAGGLISFHSLSTQYDKIVIQRDTVIITAPYYSLMNQCDSLYCVIDSIQNLNSKLEKELNIALFKIDRIKEYNRIAGNGNNIKYLRGWINRTLNEN